MKKWKCTICGQIVEDFHERLSTDCHCDFCGKDLEHVEDIYEYGVCAECRACMKCIDYDNDGICDRENCGLGIDLDDSIILPPDIIG